MSGNLSNETGFGGKTTLLKNIVGLWFIQQCRSQWKEEGREYIAAKLKGAGCNQPVFAEDAVEAVLNAADGTARMISKLCNASLVIGHSRNVNSISAEIVMQAINDSTIV